MKGPSRPPDLELADGKIAFWWEEKIQLNKLIDEDAHPRCYFVNPENWSYQPVSDNTVWVPYSMCTSFWFLYKKAMISSYAKWLLEKELTK